MKLQKFVLIGVLLLVSAATLAAQNSLPDAHNDACWSSLAALRGCQLQAEAKADDYARRCTSYPEYQCLPEDIPLSAKTAKKHSAKATSATAGTSAGTTGNASATSNTKLQASGAN